MTEFFQILTTASTKNNAEEIAESLVEQKLAACVQVIGPISSTYRWKGKIERADEWMCLIKTKKNLFKKIESAIKETHSYETPEIIAVPISAGSEAYLNWLNTTT